MIRSLQVYCTLESLRLEHFDFSECGFLIMVHKKDTIACSLGVKV